VRIFKTYGHEAIRVMTEDPYRLARDIRERDQRQAEFRIVAPLHDQQVTVGEIRGGDPHAHLTRTGLWQRSVGHDEAVKAEAAADPEGPNGRTHLKGSECSIHWQDLLAFRPRGSTMAACLVECTG
jgi:hypothetical protein